jgi:hypothetical protein
LMVKGSQVPEGTQQPAGRAAPPIPPGGSR